MGGGGGKSGGSSKTDSKAAQELVAMMKRFEGETQGLRGQTIGMLEDVMSGNLSNVPIIGMATENSMAAASNTYKQTQESLASSNLAGTPFGESQLFGARQEGNLATSQVAPQIAQALMQIAPNFVLGQANTAAQGLAGAIPGMQTTKTKGKSASVGK